MTTHPPCFACDPLPSRRAENSLFPVLLYWPFDLIIAGALLALNTTRVIRSGDKNSIRYEDRHTASQVT